MDPLFVAFIVVFLVSLVATYNMGWHAGHDVHHDDERDGPGNLRPPKRPNLYV